MNTYIHILLFLIVLFLYIHLVNQYKCSEDLEVYEMDYTDNAYLQEVCDIKQPILFEYKSHNPDFFENINIDHILNVGSHDVKVKTNDDYWKGDETVDYVVLPFQSARTLMVSDPGAKYFAENNDAFLEDSGLYGHFNQNDEFFKPSFTAQTKYDICIGSKNAVTPLRYHTYYRNFICVTSGKISVKMTPWKSNKYLYANTDYNNYEFWSPVNVWKPQPKYMHEMDKMKFLEFDVLAGSVLYVPPYWWYSIKYSDEPDTIVCHFTYNSIMNCVSNLKRWGLYYLQQSNTKTRVIKTLDIQSSIVDESPTDDSGTVVKDGDNTNNTSIATSLINELQHK